MSDGVYLRSRLMFSWGLESSRSVHGYEHGMLLIKRNTTSIYSFSRHGKHVRKLTTCSRPGPIDSSAKTFTVRSFGVRLVRIIFWMTDEQTSSKLEIMLICRRRGRRRLLYLDGCGSNDNFGVFDRRVSHHCQFRCRNDTDSYWTLLINYN